MVEVASSIPEVGVVRRESTVEQSPACQGQADDFTRVQLENDVHEQVIGEGEEVARPCASCSCIHRSVRTSLARDMMCM